MFCCGVPRVWRAKKKHGPSRTHVATATNKTKKPTKNQQYLHRLEVGRGDAAHGALELAVPDLAAEAVGEAGLAAAHVGRRRLLLALDLGRRVLGRLGLAPVVFFGWCEGGEASSSAAAAACLRSSDSAAARRLRPIIFTAAATKDVLFNRAIGAVAPQGNVPAAAQGKRRRRDGADAARSHMVAGSSSSGAAQKRLSNCTIS